MTLWQDIVTTALIGSDRQSPPIATNDGAFGKLLSHLDQSDREGFLLAAAGAIALYQRAGSPLTQSIKPPDPCELDDLTPCSDRAATYLELILKQEQLPLLSEWIAKATSLQQRVPDQFLPILLNFARKKPEVQIEILPILGKRGCWLGRQNPEWHYVQVLDFPETIETLEQLPPDAIALWQQANSDTRLLLLKRLRRVNPNLGRELLATTWLEETAQTRSILIQELETNLSLGDEAFLEAALNDRSKFVKRTAANFLACLPGSRLCDRMIQRLTPLIQIESGKSLRLFLEFPPVCDAAMIRDGIEEEPPKHEGEKSWWLQQIVQAVPLDFWGHTAKGTPDDLISAALNSEQAQLLIDNWIKAAHQQRHLIWAEALVNRIFLTQINLKIDDNLKANLMAIFSPAQQEFLAINALRSHPEPLNQVHPALWFLSQFRHPWSLELSQVFLQRLMDHYCQDKISVDWYFGTSLNEFSRYFARDLIPDAEGQLEPMAAPLAYSVKYPLQRFLTTLKLRWEMLQAF